MRSDHIMGCCGAMGIWDFPYIREKDTREERKIKRDGVKAYLEGRLTRARSGEATTAAFFIAILADYQREGLKDVFEDFGFVLRHGKHNPNSHNMIYIYTKDI